MSKHIHITLAEDYYRPGRGERLAVVIARWRAGDKVYDDAQPLTIPVADLWPHREYTWSARDARMEPAEWAAVLASLKRTGWRADEPLWCEIGRDGGAKVGEGNHRLAMARELGIRQVPVRFVFKSGTVRKDPQQAQRTEAPPPPPRREPAPPGGQVDPETARRIDDILGLLGG